MRMVCRRLLQIRSVFLPSWCTAISEIWRRKRWIGFSCRLSPRYRLRIRRKLASPCAGGGKRISHRDPKFRRSREAVPDSPLTRRSSIGIGRKTGISSSPNIWKRNSKFQGKVCWQLSKWRMRRKIRSGRNCREEGRGGFWKRWSGQEAMR